jgi:hypothetical protein
MDNLSGTWISHIIMAHSYGWYVHISNYPYVPIMMFVTNLHMVHTNA